MKLLGGLSAENFLNTYWQKKPYLIRQSIPKFDCPLTLEEIAGLALEDNVESRLVIEEKDQGTWLLKNGPFQEDDFTKLPESHWSLLVQSVETHIPYMADFMDCFAFIPNWRRDDVMISIAQDQGNVGPHLDSYDVFLFQAYGTKEWSINEFDYSESDILDDNELRLIPDFKATESWLLQPGDMLYLPPGVAHLGVAQGDCMTFSVGFRAPTQLELLNDFCDQASMNHFPTARYSDPDLKTQTAAGELDSRILGHIQEFMLQQFSDRSQFNRWFASYSTTGDFKPRQEFPLDKKTFIDSCKQFDLVREGGVRAIFIEHENNISLFLNGEEIVLSVDMRHIVKAICQSHRIDFDTCDSPEARDLLLELYQKGFYFFDE